MPGGLLDVTPALAPERAALLDLLRGLSTEDWERPTECPEWTVKGLVLHVLGDDLSLLSRQRDASLDGLTLYAIDHPGVTFRALLDGFNEQWVTAASFLSDMRMSFLGGGVGQRKIWHAGQGRTMGILRSGTAGPNAVVGQRPFAASSWPGLSNPRL